MNVKNVDEMVFETTHVLEFELTELAKSFGLPNPFLDPDEIYLDISDKYISDFRETYDEDLKDIPDKVLRSAMKKAHLKAIHEKYRKMVEKSLKEKIMNVMGAHFEYNDYENYYIGTTGGIKNIKFEGEKVKIKATEKLTHTINAMMNGMDGSNPSGETPEELLSDTATKKDFIEKFIWKLKYYYDIYGAKKPKPDIEGLNRNMYSYFNDEVLKENLKNYGG